MDDPFNLTRFVEAQEPVYDRVCAELQAGRKRSHWMWFIFPQMRGLGSSETSRLYAISGRPEAEAYLQHKVLGPRLLDCTRLVNAVSGRSAHDIFGSPDDVKFRSCMTLFAAMSEQDSVFREALDRYFDGQADAATVAKL